MSHNRSSSSMALAEAGVTFDEDGRPDGFLIGKAARISDWLFKREQLEGEKLIAELTEKRNRNTRICRECGSRYTPNYSYQRFCAPRCNSRYFARQGTRKRNRGLRNRSVRKNVTDVLKEEQWLLMTEIVDRTGLRKHPVKSALSNLLRDDIIIHDGKNRYRRYACPEQAKETTECQTD